MSGLRTRSIALLALCACTMLSACVRNESAGTPAHADKLTVALAQEPVSLDPLLLEGPIAYTVSELLYSYLTNYDADGNIIPDVASQVPTPANGGVSADGKRVTFHLRHSVRWQDGAPLTSRDVVFTFRAIMSPNNNLPERYGYDKVVSIAAPDPYTVTITLKEPFAPIVPLFLGGDSNYPIVPEHVLGRYPSINRADFNQSPIGAGPYKVVRWLHGDRLVLDANPLYYRGKPAIGRLELPFIHDPGTIVNQLQTGELDAAFNLDASRISSLRALPAHQTIVTPTPYFYALAFNLQDPALRDPDVRRALALAIDRPTIVQKVSHGLYDSRTGLRGLFTWAFDPKADSLRYDPALARKLLRGRHLQLQLAYPTGNDILAQFATAVAAAESSVGVDVTIKRYTREMYMANDGPVMQGRYQIGLYNYQSQYDPDAAWLFACNQQSPHGFNEARYCNGAVDRAFIRASSVFDGAARKREYAAIQARIIQDVPYFFLCQASEVDVIPQGLHNFDRPLLSPFLSVGKWSFQNGRAAAR